MRNRALSRTITFVGLLSVASLGCGKSDGGRAGSGGGIGALGTGGVPMPGSGGGDGRDASATGGVSGSGGQNASGGTPGSGGQSASGGTPGSGGQSAWGGISGGGGSSGETSGTGGRSGSGGTPAAGGSSSSGGQPGSGGQAGRGSGGTAATGGAGGQRSISFGTFLAAPAVVSAAQQLAKAQANPGSSQWQAKGDQHRQYHFAAANADEPYRLYVPTNWDGKTSLPLAMFLHGAGADESTYVDQNNKQMLTLAQQHGYLLVAPLGDKGAYGNFLRLTTPFGQPDAAAKLVAQATAADELTNELSEQDVINVLELVLAEYPVDRTAMFLFGHSMGSGGTWYIGGKYATYWTGLAPMSGPFVQETGYPWDALRDIPLFVTEGTQAPSVDASHLLRDWLKTNGFMSTYEEVNADHPGMVPLVLPDVFSFFDRSRGK